MYVLELVVVVGLFNKGRLIFLILNHGCCCFGELDLRCLGGIAVPVVDEGYFGEIS